MSARVRAEPGRLSKYAVLAVGAAAVVFGLYQIGLVSLWSLNDSRLSAEQLRIAAWGPISAFARTCAPRLSAPARTLLVDPADAPTGATNYGLPADLDLDDMRAFEYFMYPRQIAGLGHVPADWASAEAGIDYVALWAPIENRTAVANEQARASEAALSQALTPVCTYADAAGNRGIIFAVGASGAPAAGAEYPDVAGFDWRIAIGLASLWLIGLVAAQVVQLAGVRFGRGLAAAVALPLGCVAITLELLCVSLAGLSWSLTWLLLPWCVLGLIVAARAVVFGGWRTRSLPATLPRIAPVDILLGLLLGGLIVGVSLAAFANLPRSDGFHFGYFQARAFFVDGGVRPYYMRSAELVFTANAHPPLVPLSLTWLYMLAGRIDERSTLLLWPALWCSLLGGFAALVATRAPRRAALACTLIFAVVTYDLATAAFGRAPDAPNRAGFADLPLAVYLMLAAGVLWRHVGARGCRWRMAVLAGLLLVGAGLTKEEGSFAAVVMLAAVPLLMSWPAEGGVLGWLRRAWPSVAAGGLVFVTGMLPWVFVRVHYALPEMIVQANRGAGVLIEAFPIAVGGVVARIVPRWALPATILLVAAWLRLRNGTPVSGVFARRTWFLLSLVAIQLGVVTVAMLFGPNEIHLELVEGAQRLILQLVPLPFLAAVDYLWLAKRLEQPTRLYEAAPPASILSTEDRQHELRA